MLITLPSGRFRSTLRLALSIPTTRARTSIASAAAALPGSDALTATACGGCCACTPSDAATSTANMSFCMTGSLFTRQRMKSLSESIERLDARPHPDQQREAGQRNQETEEKERLPAETRDQVARRRADVDAPHRRQRGQQRVLGR